MAAGDDFDQTGFELATAPLAARADPAQPELLADDCSQPDAADGEPVFGAGDAGLPLPEDDFAQADALESV